MNPLKPGNFNYGEFHFDFSPFYVGKGSYNRLYDHLKKANQLLENELVEKIQNKEIYNTHKLNTIKKILKNKKEPIILKIIENMIEDNAYEFEKYLIKTIGRKDKKLGPLTNWTDGGKGPSNPSDSIKEKISITKIKNNSNRAWNKGLTKETNKSIKRISELQIQLYKDNPEEGKRRAKKANIIKNTKEWKETIGKKHKENYIQTVSDPVWKETKGKVGANKRSIILKQKHKSSEITSSIKGFTKFNHKGLMKGSIKHKEKINNKEWKKTKGEERIKKFKEKVNDPVWKETKGKESYRKMVEKRKQNGTYVSQNKKPVINISTNKIFDSIKDASNYYNISSICIRSCCQGKKETCKLGFHWQYLKDYNEQHNIKNNSTLNLF